MKQKIKNNISINLAQVRVIFVSVLNVNAFDLKFEYFKKSLNFVLEFLVKYTIAGL